MTRSSAVVACIAALFAFKPASAAFFQQNDKSSDSDTDLYDPTQWDQKRAPTDFDSIQLPGYASDKRFHLTASHTNIISTIWFKSGHNNAALEGGSTLRFDTCGYEFLLPSSTTPYAAQLLWQTYVPAGKSIASGDYTLASLTRTAASTSAAAVMRDFSFRQTTVGDYSTEIRFERGEFNAFNPELPENGEPDGSGVYTFTVGFETPIPVNAIWSPGTLFKVPRFEIERGQVTTVFNGAKVFADGSFTQRGMTFVTNGAEISVGFLGGTGAGVFGQNAGAFLLAGENTSLKTKGDFSVHGGEFTNDSASVAVGGQLNNHAKYVQTAGKTQVDGYYYSSKNESLLSLKGGKFAIASSYGIFTGCGLVSVEGGSLVADRLRNSGGSGSDLRLVQSGGLIEFAGNTRPGVWACESGLEKFSMELLGGELRTPLVRGIKTGAGHAGSAQFVGNGGRLVATVSSPEKTTDNVAFLSGFDSVTVGEKGLVIDTGSHDVLVVQDIADAEGESGMLRKTGSGTLSYEGKLSVHAVSVADGCFKVVGASSAVDGGLTVSNAKLSLAGSCNSIAVNGLEMANAVVELDPGDVIAVGGSLKLDNVSVSWTSAPEGPQQFLVVDGELADDVQDEIAKMSLVGGAAGCHAEAAVAYDASTGKTTVTVEVVRDAPLSGRTVWNDVGMVWQVAENWESGSVPTVKDTAVFGASGNGSTVMVRDGDKAGALEFAGGEYTLAGAGAALRLHGAQGGGRIDVANGSHEIACGLDLVAKVPVCLSANSQLRISGTVTDGGLDKQGLGRLELAGRLATRQGVTLREGFVAASGEGSLGTTDRDSVVMSGGVLEIAQGASISVPGKASVSTPAVQKSVVVKSEGDVAFSAFSADRGFLVKRGKGTMTVEVPSGATVALSAGENQIGQGDHHTADAGIGFPADGSEPTGMRGPVSIVEGELRIEGKGPGARVESPGTVYVTVPTAASVSAQPMLTVDGATLVCKELYNGWRLGRPAFSARSSTIRALNGAVVDWKSSMPGYACTVDGFFATYAATNSAFRYVADGAYLTRGRLDGDGTTPIVRYFLNNSSFEVGSSMVLDGSVMMDLDNCSRYGRPDGRTTSFSYGTPARVYGEIFTRNGSCLALNGISEQSGQTRDLTLAFDGGEWQWSDDFGDRTLEPSLGHVKWEMRGRGAILRPAANMTLRINATFAGNGGIVVDGPGTIAFGAGAYGFSGTADVRQGTLDLAAAGMLRGASFSGDGTVKGAALDRPCIVALLSDGWENTNGVPVLLDCVLDGSVTVKTGRTDENALMLPQVRTPTPVAKIAGSTVVDVAKWRIDKKGLEGAIGEFSLIGDTVYLTPAAAPGFLVVVR